MTFSGIKYLLFRNYLVLLYSALLPVLFWRVEPNLRGVIWSDAEGYYVYLPAVFNLGDVHAIPSGSMSPILNDKGEMVVKYTCGVAYFQMPFFLIARAYCEKRGLPPEDIYNIHYARAIALAGFSAAFVGLFFLQSTLRRRFREPVVFLTLLSILGGTNLFHYATKEPGMSHAYSFGLIAIFAWQVPRFYRSPNYVNTVLLGGLMGWIVLIRPTNAILLSFLLLADVFSRDDLRSRLQFYRQHSRLLAVAAVVAFLFFIPQMFYWKEMTGAWVQYSYTHEGFIYWKHPKILQVLFDPQNGLFVYSPMALLAVAGLVVGWRDPRVNAPAVTVVFLVGTYLFSSWWAWWFGGAFGHRCYVDIYPLLALPLAGILDALLRLHSSGHRLLFWGGGGVGWLFLIFYSVQMSLLYVHLGGPWDGPDWQWNWEKIRVIWAHLFDFSYLK